jgi:aminoglycoside phosphotransferase (APT) family kinase protein
MPAADVDVSSDLVRRLLADQFPDLAELPVEFMANGWDNVLFRVGDKLIARLPRREPAAGILLNEQRWLPVLAPALELPIPSPERTGLPAHGYPWSWSVVRYLPGVPAADADGLDLPSVPAVIGRFLASLHVPAPADAPANPGRVRSRHPRTRDRRSGCTATCALDGAIWTRARGWALVLALAFLANSGDNPQMMGVGRRTLRRVLS